MNIFIIRHGQSTANAGTASTDILDKKIDLTEKGEKQAEQCGKLLLNYCIENDINLQSSIMINSPYKRAQKTANLINQSLKITQKTSYTLCEYQKGTENQDITIPKNGFLEKIYNKLCENEDSIDESPVEIVLRAKVFINSLKKLNYENVFIVSHYGFIRALDIALLNKPITTYFNGPKIKNCSVRHYMLKENNCTFIDNVDNILIIEK